MEVYGVSLVKITRQTVVVTHKAPEDADMVVAVYEEESGRMAASGHERVKAHGMTAELALYGDGLPQYYTMQAYLTDSVSNRPLYRVQVREHLRNHLTLKATKIEIVDVDGKKLAAGKDYEKTLVYTYEAETTLQDGTVRKAGDNIQKTDIIPAGTLLRVAASAKAGGNYSGELSTTYRITKADIGKAKVKIPAQTMRL